jgi:hypothetical protein
MEKYINCYANFDFDLRLADDQYSYRIEPESRFNKPLQYLFLWVAERYESLYGPQFEHYSFYQHKINKTKGFCPEITINKDKMHFWWGSCESEEAWSREKIINLKIISHKAEKKLALDIKDNDQLNNGYLIKNEHGFSGLGHRQVKEYESAGQVIERKLERTEDYSSLINNDAICIYKNIIDDYFQYRGTLIGHDSDDLLLATDFKKNLKVIFDHYQAHYSVDQLQVDSFIFLEGSKHKWRYLCEVNHRKSMGFVANELHRNLGNKVSLFILLPKCSLKLVDKDNSDYCEKRREGVLQLSHPSESLQSFFITSISMESLRGFIVNLDQLIGLGKNLNAYLKSL